MLPKSILEEFRNIEIDLARANMRITFEVYMGLTVFASVISGVVALAISFLVTFSILLSFIVGLTVFLSTICACYLYPSITISSRARKIEANLPLTANFMAVLASAGMPPERIFRSLANVGDEFGLGSEIRRIVGDIEVLGYDLNAALKKGALRSASRKFGAMLDGVVTTAHTGGDLAAYMRESAEKYKKARVSSMRSFIDSLAGMAEVYVSFMIALPLTLVVLLTVMSFLGGGSMLGGLSPQTLLDLLVYVITPVGVVVILLIIDSMTPPR